MGLVIKFIPKGDKNEENKYSRRVNIFDMAKMIEDTQKRCVEETLGYVCIEYNKLLQQKQLAVSNPQFYQRIKNIFESILDDPEYNHDGDTYSVLVYFIIKYIHPFDIEIESDEITIIGRYGDEHERGYLATLNILLSSYQDILKIKKVKPLDIFTGFRLNA